MFIAASKKTSPDNTIICNISAQRCTGMFSIPVVDFYRAIFSNAIIAVSTTQIKFCYHNNVRKTTIDSSSQVYLWAGGFH